MNNALFIARVEDMLTQCERNSTPKFLGFLTEEEAAGADAFLKKLGAKFTFFGGYSQAARQVLCCLPDWCDAPDFPITGLTFSFRECDTLSHRDFLGALMALGITRESVGDILVKPGCAVIFVRNEVLEFVKSQVDKVGSAGVTVTEGFSLPLPGMGKLVSCTDTVASLRLDCVVGALCGFSRSEAVKMIEDGKVSVNSLCVEKPTKAINSGDRITVRGKGKFMIDSADARSRKGRIILNYNKFL